MVFRILPMQLKRIMDKPLSLFLLSQYDCEILHEIHWGVTYLYVLPKEPRYKSFIRIGSPGQFCCDCYHIWASSLVRRRPRYDFLDPPDA